MPMPRRAPESSRSPLQLALQFELPFYPLAAPPDAVAPVIAGEPRDQSATPEPGTATRLRRITLSQGPVQYQLKRSRRRSIGFVIDEEGLVVTAPRWVTVAQIEEAIAEKERWIRNKSAEMRERRRAVPRVRWEDGGSLPYLGALLTLRLSEGRASEAVRFDESARTLTVSLPPKAGPQQMKDRVQGWLQVEARTLFAERLAFYAERLGVRHSALRLSSAATRWGSCSADGRILLNWRLIHFPLSSIDYVVAHELAHLKEMNHGPRFWRTVAEILPGFEAARDHLKDPPVELLPVL